MALRTINGRTYYYKSVRAGGRVVTAYLGAGRAGLRAATEAAKRRREREARRAAERAELERLRADEAESERAFEAAEAVFRRAMEAAGFHRPKRVWRKRRMKAIESERPPVLTNGEARDIVGRLHARAAVSDEEADRFRRHLECDPPGRGFRELIGDVESWARDAQVRQLDPAVRVVQEVNVAERRRTLYGDSPTDLERLLADRVVFNWVTLYRLEGWSLEKGGHSIAIAEHIDRRIDRANRRYLASIKALALVRRLGPGASVTLSQTVSVKVTSPGEPPPQPALPA